jgi:2,4-dienoyl-CoA reductase-like NADH-dependent reductase (Old Yellow Enzyme family)/thioredoxin reductase
MLKRALEPLDVGPLRVPSRVLMAAMDVALDDHGDVSDAYVEFLTRRAHSGLAWVTTGGVAVRGDGLTSMQQLRLDEDRRTDGVRRLADAVHAAGCRLVVQLTHAGRQTLASVIDTDPIAPSPIPCPVMRQPPRVLDEAEMPALVAAFGDAARRAADAGVDGIELHMGHGYLLNSFLSPDSNRRTDGYGGDTERRCRLPGEVIAAVREAVGPRRPVIARFSADEKVDGGIDPDEAVEVALQLQRWGADALHVSACTYGSMMWNIPVYLLPDAPFRALAARIRRAVDVPVIAVGRLHRAELIEDVLDSGDADLVAVGRPLIADPEFFAHLRRGTQPRACLKCNQCIQSVAYGPVACSVNSLVRRGERPPGPSSRARRVLVVGGGPAGMHTAALASGAGHTVRLLEHGEHLGGLLGVAAVGPGKAPIAALRRSLAEDLDASVAEVRLATPLDATELADFDPDVVVDATGSEALRPAVEGEATFPIVTVDQALADLPAPDSLVAVLGGGATGVEAAHALVSAGVRVVLLEKRPRIGVGLVPHIRFHLLRLLDDHGVEVLSRVRSLSCEGAALAVRMRKAERTLEGLDLLVLATGRESKGIDPAIKSGLRVEVITVGDALEPGSILEALQGARRAVEDLTGPR